MNILMFRTDIQSPIGIQSVWEALQPLGIKSFSIDFSDFNHALSVVSEELITPQSISTALKGIGYYSEYLSK
ncbi:MULTISPECIES: hypothetical protein [Bacteroidota]|jgi:hypothetical protein|uniref:Uncharacterized protein n=1 Tax=Flectobacillus rivi TaxID=2984209 RepID=A0ABT6Z7W1_9BACT|nr:MULTISPECIES: hypothetical protein [Bacteroidota]MDI9877231.1 hypothetical protein [Flectobacillus rivi]NBB28956.1 hypothetical protein [Cellulophaga sp. BC115SP]